jgi:hypothetical protein
MPDYDSGWVKTCTSSGIVTLQHNLGTTELLVYAMYKNDKGVGMVDRDLIQWNTLNESTINVRLMGWACEECVRIVVWKLTTMFNNFIFGQSNPM